MNMSLAPEALIASTIARIDQLIAAQVNAILHHPRFQQLESAWRGVQLLVKEQRAAAKYVKIRLLDASWPEIVRDIERSLDVDQSALFARIYSNEFDMPGGEPYGVLLCHYWIDHRRPADIATLKGLANIAAAAFCPFFFPTSPSLFGVESFHELTTTNLDQLFRHADYAGWNQLRKMEDAQFLAFILPGLLLRAPWGEHRPIIGKLRFKEQIERHQDLLWGHPGLALAQVLIREFDQVGWFAHIRGAPRDTLAGGVVTQPPTLAKQVPDAALSHLPATEIVLTDSTERELNSQGLIALTHCWNTPYCAFVHLPSLHASTTDGKRPENSSQRISAQIQNILCASRFAHYIKVMMRDKVGTFASAVECETHLSRWLEQYAIANDSADWSTQARYPLRMFRVEVYEDQWRAQHYLCNIYLTPHYQIDGVVSEIKLTTELGRA